MKPQQADVAVIVPAYNAAGFLDQALASVAAQTVRPTVVIVVDDCSVDDTSEVAHGWQDRLPLSILRLDRNVGPSGARHEAIVSTNVSLLALLDADDYWFPDHLEAMLSCYEACPGVISSNHLAWIAGRSTVIPSAARKPLPPVERQLTVLLQRNFVNAGALFSRELYDRVGGFRSQFRGTEDWDLWIRMARAGAPVIRVPQHTALYRLSRTSLSSSIDPATELRLVEQELAVLNIAAIESPSRSEQMAVRLGLRRLRAKRSYFIARSLAFDGRWSAARVTALGGLVGDRSIALRSAAITMVPGLAIRWRHARANRASL
jgi:glycosyltransferase involved in cell wall biosynthesis